MGSGSGKLGDVGEVGESEGNTEEEEEEAPRRTGARGREGVGNAEGGSELEGLDMALTEEKEGELG